MTVAAQPGESVPHFNVDVYFLELTALFQIKGVKMWGYCRGTSVVCGASLFVVKTYLQSKTKEVSEGKLSIVTLL